ncbi:head GIN domain-containing protein [Hydrobacter penzbergensis]|nr:head GIN domain-containing protein [Hydrobacter penzbergensis]
MKKWLLVVLMGVCLLQAGAQDKNIVRDDNVQVRPISGFTGIEVSGAISLYLSQGNEEAVAVSAGSDEDAGRIRTELKNGVLHITPQKSGWSWSNKRMKAYVTFKTLKRIEASGACNIRLTDAVKLEKLEIELSGASDFSGKVQTALLRLVATGASRITISGEANKTQVEASGASGIKGYELYTDYCKVNASGASSIHLTVNKEIDASASGGSGIYYKGQGLVRDSNISGGATFKRKAED